MGEIVTKNLQVKVSLRGELAEHFLELKKRLGISHDSEVCRYCLMKVASTELEGVAR